MSEKDSPASTGNQENSVEFPLAETVNRADSWKKIFAATRMWIATAICGIVALVLIITSIGGGGRTISISFLDGFGIKPGDTLRYRGIDVGEVTAVNVNTDLRGVTVRVKLEEHADKIAREGSRFWIERPQVGLSRVSGLETVVGAKFIGVIPGPDDASPATRFEGINSPPVLRGGSATEITISFIDGHGISVGDVVKHLGIVVGEVTAVRLQESLDAVTVHVRLSDSASSLARTGSLFWIERAQLGLSEVRGLETLIQGQFIAVSPGPPDGQPISRFQGVENRPPAARSADGLEITLYANQKRGLVTGVPIKYRGVTVGHIVSVGLTSDSSAVQARAYLMPDYKSLVRSNSRFWSNDGIDADLGVSGFNLKTDSLQSLILGSISFATPDEPGRLARTGDRFACAPTFDDEWLQWNPQIALGLELLPSGGDRPDTVRSVIRWDQKTLGFTRVVQRQGWLIVLENDQLYGLRKFLEPDSAAIDGSTRIEMRGEEISFRPEQSTTEEGLAKYTLEDKIKTPIGRWPLNRIRRPTAAEDCLIVADPQASMFPISVNRIVRATDNRWYIDESISMSDSWDGACVVSRRDGFLVGFLTFEKGQAVVELATNK